MKKFKLVNGEGWEKSFVEGKTYKETDVDYLGQSVKDLQKAFRYDWELVVEEVELPKKFKFLGDIEACGDDGSYRGLVIGDVYSLTDRCPDAEDVVEDYNFVKYYVEMYPNDWEEVLVTLSPTGSGNIYVREAIKPFTDAEVVTLITFLNDNFEDFEVCINEPLKGGITYETYLELFGEFSVDKASLLIDKLEKNNTPLTEAEKVTLITFLNDRFEDFKLSLFRDITVGTWGELDGGAFNEADLLIDKI